MLPDVRLRPLPRLAARLVEADRPVGPAPAAPVPRLLRPVLAVLPDAARGPAGRGSL